MSSAKILVVEDEWLMAQGIQDYLRDLGYTLAGWAASGEEALRLAEVCRPDMVLMDIMLKGEMDGIEAAELLRRRFGVPVVYLTAYADPQTLNRAKLTEPYGYILKPFEIRELHSIIEITLYKFQAEKRLAHLRQVLLAIRAVDQLIVQEKDRDSLIHRACQVLTAGRGYVLAWIALLDEAGQVAAWAAAGAEEDTRPLCQGLAQGQLPRSGRTALEQAALVATEIFGHRPGDCPQGPQGLDRGELVTPLIHQGVCHGVLGVLLPAALTRDEEERALFREIAADLSLALHNLDLTAREQQARQALKASEEKFRLLFDKAPLGYQSMDGQGRILAVNQTWLDTMGYGEEEVLGEPFSHFLTPRGMEQFQDCFPKLQDLGEANGVEVQVYTKDRAILDLKFWGRLAWDQEGRFQQTHCIFSDITGSNRIQQELAEKNRLNQILLDAFPFIALLQHPGSREIVAANAAAAKAGAVPGTHCYQSWFGRQEPCPWCLAPALWATGKPQHREMSVGQSTWDVHWLPVADDLYLHFAFDVTESRQFKDQYENIIRLTQDGYATTDVRGRFLDVNDAFCCMTGYNRDELLSMAISDLEPQKNAEKIARHLGEIMQTGAELFEARHRCKDGRMIDVEVSVRYLPYRGGLFVAFLRDITSRKQAEAELHRYRHHLEHLVGARTAALTAVNEELNREIIEHRQTEEALRASEARFRAIFEGASIGISLIDQNDRLVAVNPALVRTLGYTQAELDQLGISFVYKEDVPQIARLYRELTAGRMQAFTVEARAVHRDGRLIWGRAHFTRIMGTDQGTWYTLGLFEDITQEKETQAEIAAYQERLRALAAELTMTEERERRRLASDLHDNIGQVLAFLQIKLGSLRQEIASPKIAADLDEARNLLSEIIRATRSLTLEMGLSVLHELGFASGVEWLGEKFQEQYGLEIKVHCDPLPASLPSFVKTLFFRAVRELLTNVAKHARASRVSIVGKTHNSQIRLEVADNGIGFDVANLKTGQGFGLFSIAERIRNQGGTIEVLSAPGQGTRVIITFPGAD